jgi:hypothetical protein
MRPLNIGSRVCNAAEILRRDFDVQATMGALDDVDETRGSALMASSSSSRRSLIVEITAATLVDSMISRRGSSKY